MPEATRQAVSKDDAKKELARRRLAQRDVIRYGQYMRPDFRVHPHQQYLARELYEVERYVQTKGAEGTGNLMVLMPPQHGKSTTVSHLFPSWELGRNPDWPFILTSYNDQKASSNSRIVREFVGDKKFRPLFGDLAGNMPYPVELSSDSRSVSEWRLSSPHRGGMIAAGVGGGITGYPSKITIIDDPFKNREEADSEDRQEKVMDWYETSVYTRRQVGSAIILFHTRWGVRDLAGRLIRQMITNPKADQWKIVMLPALALQENEYSKDEKEQRERMAEEGTFVPLADQLGRKPGEALCPEIMPQEMLENIRENMSLYNWLSMYAQMPTGRSGNMFNRSWFKIEKKIPDDIRFARALWHWDKAAKAGSGDFTVGVLMAIDQHGRIWVLDVVRGQWGTFERNEQMRKAWNAARERFGDRVPVPQIWHQQDPAGAGLDSARATNVALAGLPAHFELLSGDKEVRADPWATALEGDNVVLLLGIWNQPFIEEHIPFPKGRYDDQVDAASACYTRLTLRGARKEGHSYQG